MTSYSPARFGCSSALIEPLEGRTLLSASLDRLAVFSSAPVSPLLADSAGNLFGTTNGGGPGGDGTLFRISPNAHAVWTLATFDGIDGAHPSGKLVADAAGNLYGTTQAGGADGLGVIYKLAAGSHTLTDLFSFHGTDGETPNGSLVIDSAGNLLGTTEYGGPGNAGTVFEVSTKTGKFTTLAALDSTLGQCPTAGLVSDAVGNLFGTTAVGGAGGVGTIFEVAANTRRVTTVLSFDGTTADYSYFAYDGPKSPLVIDAWGNFYGSVMGSSTIYKVAAGTRAVTQLASFGPTYDPIPGISGLTIDAAGNLFGTSPAGGAFGKGSVFKLDPVSAKVTTLISLAGNGASQFSSTLVSDSAGNLYGTELLSASDQGVVFEIKAGTFVSAQDFSAFGPYTLDAKHHLLTAAGDLVQGYTANNAGIIQTGKIGPITIPIGATIVKATTMASLIGNLCACEPNTTTVMTVYNAAGLPVTVALTLGVVKESAGGTVWKFNAALQNTAQTPIGAGTLIFDRTGKLTSATGNHLVIPQAGPAIKVTLDFSGVLASAATGDSAIFLLQQDGFPPGSLNSYYVDPDGTVGGSYTNGETKTLGRIVDIGDDDFRSGV